MIEIKNAFGIPRFQTEAEEAILGLDIHLQAASLHIEARVPGVLSLE